MQTEIDIKYIFMVKYHIYASVLYMAGSGKNKKDNGIFSDKTLPKIDLEKTRTHTISKGSWFLIITFFISLLFTMVFYSIKIFTHSITPQDTTEKFINALKSGDIEALLNDQELNYRTIALREVSKRGLEEYNKVKNAFDNCIEEGIKKYRKLKTKIFSIGEESFKTLPPKTQYLVKNRAKLLWIYSRGMKIIKNEIAKMIDDPEVFISNEKSLSILIKLGTESIKTHPSSSIPSPENFPQPNRNLKFPKGSIYEKIRQAGAVKFESIKKKVYQAGMREFMKLPRDRQELLQKKSKIDFIVSEALKQLSEEEKSLVWAPRMFYPDTSEQTEALKLCLPLIPMDQRKLIQAADYNKFSTEKEIYIHRAGIEGYKNFLKNLLSSCRYSIKKVSYYGKFPSDLIKTSRVKIEVNWVNCSEAQAYVPSTFHLVLKNGRWQIIWKKKISAESEKLAAELKAIGLDELMKNNLNKQKP